MSIGYRIQEFTAGSGRQCDSNCRESVMSCQQSLDQQPPHNAKETVIYKNIVRLQKEKIQRLTSFCN